MAGKRIYAPSILINSVEYKCKARSVTLEPGNWINFCEQEWTFEAEIELGYDTTESWNLLNALEDTVTTVVLKPEDATVAATNPSASFSIRMPAVPFLTGSSRGDRQTFTLSQVTEAAPVFSVGA